MAVQVSLKLSGVEFAKARLATVERSVDPVIRGALNTTATKTRQEKYFKPLGTTFKSSLLGRALAGADMRGKIVVKRAGRKYRDARLIPSSSSVLVDDYRNWVYEVLSPTRARIWVTGPHGRKVAAGFVNPASAGRKPLSSRSVKRGRKTYTYQQGLTAALGPSTAYWFKQLTTPGTIRWTNGFLMREFEKRIRKEIAKATA